MLEYKISVVLYDFIHMVVRRVDNCMSLKEECMPFTDFKENKCNKRIISTVLRT